MTPPSLSRDRRTKIKKSLFLLQSSLPNRRFVSNFASHLPDVGTADDQLLTSSENRRLVYRQERPLGSRETGDLFPVGSY